MESRLIINLYEELEAIKKARGMGYLLSLESHTKEILNIRSCPTHPANFMASTGLQTQFSSEAMKVRFLSAIHTDFFAWRLHTARVVLPSVCSVSGRMNSSVFMAASLRASNHLHAHFGFVPTV
jgi:hypothetical protein